MCCRWSSGWGDIRRPVGKPLGREKLGMPVGWGRLEGGAGAEAVGLASWATGAAMALGEHVSLVGWVAAFSDLPCGEESSDDGNLHVEVERGVSENDREETWTAETKSCCRCSSESWKDAVHLYLFLLCVCSRVELCKLCLLREHVES